ncbi:MAG: hypothetical protein IJV16_01600 [Lachnospiraceae bacterium]|nr:hypothetical protein [Lachnospiraceae bacterium]
MQLQDRIDKARAKAAEINASIIEADRKIEAYKELTVYVKNYQQYKNISDAYKNSKNKEKFFEAHESQLMIFETAEREIRFKGFDPAKVTYEQIMEGIEKFKRQEIEARTEYMAVSKDLSDMEQQMRMMREYLGREDLSSKERHKSSLKENAHSR